MRRLIVVALLVSLSGCLSLDKSQADGGKVFDLADVFLPLEDIRERSDLLDTVIASDTAISTVGRSAYVKSLDEFLARKPEGSPDFNAVLRHEQEHSRRQLAMGTYLWVARYAYDREFALLEEQIGYYWEIKTLQYAGRFVDASRYAAILDKYENLSGDLISYADALEWVRQAKLNRWTPPTD